MTRTLSIAPSARRAATSAGSARVADDGTSSMPSRLDDLAAQRLAEAVAGASLISLRRKCGESPRSMSRVVTSAVGDLGLGDRQLGAVVGQPADAVELAGVGAVEHEHLAAAAVDRSTGVSPSMRR